NRPLWTEPCAIVDSYIAAMELFRITEDVKWLETAQRIYYNALCHAQRENGGFGCDNCVGADTLFLTVHGGGIDASWCCTMRGGEGLAEVVKSIALEKDGVPHIALYNPAEIRLPDCTMELRTTYPADGHVELLLKGRPQAGKIALFLPSYAREGVVNVDGTRKVMTSQNGFITVDVAENSRVTLDFTIPVQKLECNTLGAPEGCYKLAYGFTLLGVRGHEETRPDITRLVSLGNGCYQAGNTQLCPIGNTYKIPMADLPDHYWQLLFRA
ncbi:MAG: glycoside hydrolase family 127 protein, partial [Clostridia bacterium]|nr:glycoside hydrolase family 127 protein [Clostridia bacterium]